MRLRSIVHAAIEHFLQRLTTRHEDAAVRVKRLALDEKRDVAVGVRVVQQAAQVGVQRGFIRFA
jgi:hypothetical protein